jgi:hypothetical protein
VELVRRETRQARLQEARRVIEERYEEKRRAEQVEYEAKIAAREAKKAAGKRVGGKAPQPPPAEPPAKDQYNFTDPESRIMKAGSGKRFEQAYNAQAAVDIEGSMLVTGGFVTDAANDKEQLAPVMAAVEPAIRQVDKVLADNGYYSENQIKAVEKEEAEPTVYVATGKEAHHPTVTELMPKSDPPPPPATASVKEIMAYRLKTREGKDLYKLRKQTVEPVFGIIKEVLGFRRFSPRRLVKVNLEWKLVLRANNCKRLHVLANRCGVPIGEQKAA